MLSKYVRDTQFHDIDRRQSILLILGIAKMKIDVGVYYR